MFEKSRWLREDPKWLTPPTFGHCPFGWVGLNADIIKSNRRLIADPKVPAKARILRQKCHLRQNSVNCDKCDNLHQNSTICIKTALFA